MSGRTLFLAVAAVAAVTFILAAFNPMSRNEVPRNAVNRIADWPKDRPPQHFLVVTYPESPGDASTGVGDRCPLLFNADGMFSIVVPGDVVWTCGVMNGRVSLHARFQVSEVIGYDEATKRTRKRLYRSDAYLWAAPADRVRIRNTDISDIVSKLRFFDSLQPESIQPAPDGWFETESFYQIRALTPESVGLLEEAYKTRPDGIVR